MNELHNALNVAESQMFIEWLIHNYSRQEIAQNVPDFGDAMCKQCRHTSMAYLGSNPVTTGKLNYLYLSSLICWMGVYDPHRIIVKNKEITWKVPPRYLAY